MRVAKLVKIGQKTKFILILLDNYSLQMYRFRLGCSKFILPILWGILFVICLLAPNYPDLVARYYNQGLFKYWTIGLRWLFGSIPVAIGELIYYTFIIVLIINIIRYFISIKSLNQIKRNIGITLLKVIWLGIRLFVVFQLIWGLNYMQPDPTNAFNIQVQTPKNAQIALDQMNALTYELIQELNITKEEITSTKAKTPNFDQLVYHIHQDYEKVSGSYPRLKIEQQSVKKAIFPIFGDYIGYLAFYQPITGEAIVRADLPLLTQPYTIAHEMAHQLGYASETEANFIAFVVASESKDPVLKYSMLLQMFSYAQDAQLLLLAGTKGFDAWKMQIAKNKAMLSPAVLKDRAAIKAFFAARAVKQIQASNQLYDQFLKWNQQAAGLDSYADVLKWVRAYRLKIYSSTSYSR